MNQGGSSAEKSGEKSKSESHPLQNLKFTDIHSVQSSKSIESLFTPAMDVRPRAYMGSNIKHPMFYLTPPSNENGEIQSVSSDNVKAEHVFWGTNISMTEISVKFRQFLLNFKPRDDEDNQGGNYYYRQLAEIKETKVYFLNVDGSHINSFDRQLYWQLINFPNEMLPLLDLVVNTVFAEIYYNIAEEKPQNLIHVRISSLISQSRIRDLGPKDIDKLISISGIVIRNSEIIPEMKDAFFKCAVCGKTENSILQRSAIVEPNDCSNCRTKYSFELIHNRSVYNDKQHVKLQETPEHMPEGETPLTIHLCCYEELVDFVKPGDRCELVGIFRAQGLRVNPRQRVTKSTFRTYIDVVSFSKYNKMRMNADTGEDANINNIVSNELNENYNESIQKEVDELSKNPDIYSILVESFAPSIWENEDVKKGLLLQLFGGVSQEQAKNGKGKFRGDVNVLLVGDPSTAKSQLLQYVHNLAPRGIFTSGKGSSVVGLTAYVTKDPETKELILESGALVLSDRGICCIDEFDKMDDSTRVILHEAMEQQTISIAKAGIICQLNARTAILASANPIHSRYDPKLSVIQNIRLLPSLLSRFDLIYLILDKHNEIYDRRLANHIVSLYGSDEIEYAEPQVKTAIKKEVLTAYISKARKIVPTIHETLVTDLIKHYIEMRTLGNSRNTISATPRQLESLIRLSEARARLRFSKVVEKEDVDEAIRLIRVATQQAATDPVTGVIDMDMISTGFSSSSRAKLNQIMEIIKNILRDYAETARKGVKLSSLNEELKKRVEVLGQQSFTYTEFELRDSLRMLEEDGILSQLGNKKAPTIRLIGAQFQ